MNKRTDIVFSITMFIIVVGGAVCGSLFFCKPLPDMLDSRIYAPEVLHNPKEITVVYGANTANVTEVDYNFTNYSYCTYGPWGDRTCAFDIEYVDGNGETNELKIRDPLCIEIPNGSLIIYV